MLYYLFVFGSTHLIHEVVPPGLVVNIFQGCFLCVCLFHRVVLRVVLRVSLLLRVQVMVVVGKHNCKFWLIVV